MKQMRFLALNRADAPCFCTKKKGSSNTHYTTVKYGKFTDRYFGPKVAKNAQGLWHLKIADAELDLQMTSSVMLLVGTALCTGYSPLQHHFSLVYRFGAGSDCSGGSDRSKCCNGRALDRVTKQKHRPNRQKLSTKCPKIVFSVPPDIFWTFFGHFLDIFRTFLSTFPFSGLSNDLPVTIKVGFNPGTAWIARNGFLQKLTFEIQCWTFWVLGLPSPNPLAYRHQIQGKKKHININKFPGLSRDGVGAKILFMCFFRVIPYGGEKHINKVPPQNPGTIPWKFCLSCFFLYVFLFAPTDRGRRQSKNIARVARIGKKDFRSQFLSQFLQSEQSEQTRFGPQKVMDFGMSVFAFFCNPSRRFRARKGPKRSIWTSGWLRWVNPSNPSCGFGRFLTFRAENRWPGFQN